MNENKFSKEIQNKFSLRCKKPFSGAFVGTKKVAETSILKIVLSIL